jgi:hypothetical protein
MLKGHRSADVRVLAVWEPILFTDFSEPASMVLRRLSDPRVLHFWDANHLVAEQLARYSDPSQNQPACCTQQGTLWDLAAVYPPGTLWEQRLPHALVFGGPVISQRDSIAEVLARSDVRSTR